MLLTPPASAGTAAAGPAALAAPGASLLLLLLVVPGREGLAAAAFSCCCCCLRLRRLAAVEGREPAAGWLLTAGLRPARDSTLQQRSSGSNIQSSSTAEAASLEQQHCKQQPRQQNMKALLPLINTMNIAAPKQITSPQANYPVHQHIPLTPRTHTSKMISLC